MSFDKAYQKMTCLKEDWIYGLWMFLIGNMFLFSGLLSIVMLQPIFSFKKVDEWVGLVGW